MLKKNKLYLLGIITLLGFPLLGFGFNYLFEDNFLFDILIVNSKELPAIAAGVVLGISIAMVAERLVQIPFISKSTFELTEFFKDLKLNLFDVLFLSFAAGFGEEILFRGAIQGQLGIWITSILFIAIHGYLNIFKPGIFVFGSFLTLFSFLLGFLFESHGLWSAIAAHFAYDFVLLYSLKRESEKAI